MQEAVATLFCASSSEVSPHFFAEAEALARGLARKGVSIVYGGARVGIMGHIADIALAEGGEVIGVIPQYFFERELAHPGLSELIVVGNLMDRKRKMADLATHIIACPGGLGTLDELSEVLALKQVGELDKPIAFHNVLDYWRPLFEYFTEMQQMRMIRTDPDSLFVSFDSTAKLIDYVVNDKVF